MNNLSLYARVQGFPHSLESCPDGDEEGVGLGPGNGIAIPTPAQLDPGVVLWPIACTRGRVFGSSRPVVLQAVSSIETTIQPIQIPLIFVPVAIEPSLDRDPQQRSAS